MNAAAVRKLCLSLPSVTEKVQWHGKRVFKVGDKMFAVLGSGDDAEAMSFKCSDESFRLLTEQPGFTPAPHLARAKWVRLAPIETLPDDELRAYLRRAYDIVAAALPKKAREAIAPARARTAASPARRAPRGASAK